MISPGQQLQEVSQVAAAGVVVVGVLIEGVELHHLHPSRSGPHHVGVDGVANVQDPLPGPSQGTERVLYVGDTVHADVMGATAAGMQVVQLDPFDQHADYNHARCRDLGHLLQLLAW